MSFIEWISQPWPWYVAGPMIGLTVPMLLIIGNKTFGISSSLRHACAACIPGDIKFFNYDWKKEIWNLLFVAGILIGGILVALFLTNTDPVQINPKLAEELGGFVVSSNLYQSYAPSGALVPEANVVTRVPAEKLTEVMEQSRPRGERLRTASCGGRRR